MRIHAGNLRAVWTIARRPFAASLLAGAVALAGLASCATPAKHSGPLQGSKPAVATYTEAQRQLDIESFEKVWTTIRDTHWDPAMGGIDWQAIHDELRPKVEGAESHVQARSVMQDLVHRLGKSHFGIIPSDAYDDADTGESATTTDSTTTADSTTTTTADASEKPAKPVSARSRGEGSTGVEARALDGEAVVTAVDPGSPAADAGVMTGWIISKVDGRELKPRLAKIAEAQASSFSANYYVSAAAMGALSGEEGETLDVEFLDGNNQPVLKQLTLGHAEGELTQFGNLPRMRLRIDSRRLDGPIQYFRFNMFFDPPRLATELSKAVKEAKDAKGFIIDLRGNPGGIGAIAMGVGGWFVEQKNLKLGTMTMRGGTLNFIINPRLNGFRGPLAVLIDGMSASTSEIFAAGMQDLKRARVFGTQTAGAALPSTVEILPNGDRFQYAIANYVSANGAALEGNGVTPDEVIPLDRASLLAGRDAVRDAAVAWIMSEGATKPASGGSN